MRTSSLGWLISGLQLLVALAGFPAFAGEPTFAGDGTNTGGGGDAFESRFEQIRSNLLKWIESGDARGLTLPEHLTYDAYVVKMRAALQPQALVVRFVTSEEEARTRDPEKKVLVAGQTKMCRSFISKKDLRPHILCSTERFSAADEDGKYQLTHHEFAGLVGVEQNVGAQSDYTVSRQISSERVLRFSGRREYRPCPSPLPAHTYCTSTGAVFKRVELDDFGQGWAAPDGEIFGLSIWDEVHNRGEVRDLNVIHSEAVDRCRMSGGRLPTIGSYKDLLSFFDTTPQGELTEQGKRDWLAIFPDMDGRTFWTSTLATERRTYALNGDSGRFEKDIEDTSVGPGITRSIRCVTHVIRFYYPMGGDYGPGAENPVAPASWGTILIPDSSSQVLSKLVQFLGGEKVAAGLGLKWNSEQRAYEVPFWAGYWPCRRLSEAMARGGADPNRLFRGIVLALPRRFDRGVQSPESYFDASDQDMRVSQSDFRPVPFSSRTTLWITGSFARDRLTLPKACERFL